MANAVTLTSENWEKEVASSEKLVLVDFWAEWCGPCKLVEPVLDEIAGEKSDVMTLAKVNVDDNPELQQRYQVMSIPTLMLFKDGEAVDTLIGAHPKGTIAALVDKAA